MNISWATSVGFLKGMPCYGVTLLPGGESLTLWKLLMAGGWVMIPLALCSVAVLTLILFYLLTLRKVAVLTSELSARIRPYLAKGDLNGLGNYVRERPEAVARILDEVLQFIYRHPDAEGRAIESVAEAEGSRIASLFNQRAVYLMDLGVLAPMLGLFGTVVGILRSFGSIATEAITMRTMLMAGGISQALVATAVGLLVGIFAMGFYSIFRGRVHYLIALMEGQTTPLIHEIILLHQRPKRTRAIL